MSAWTTYGSNVPVVGWVLFLTSALGVAGVVLCAALGALVACIVLRPAAEPGGTEVRTWAWAYPAYLFTATAPGPSIIRYLLLAFPLLWPVPDLLIHPGPRVSSASPSPPRVGGLLLQWVWITHFVVISAPRSAGPFP